MAVKDRLFMVNVKSTLFRKSVSWRNISGLCWLSIPNRDRPADLLGNRIMSVQLIEHQNPDYLAVLWGGKFSQENLNLYFAALDTLTEEARSLPRLHDARHINMDVSAELIRSVCKSRIELFRQGMPLIKGAVLVEDKLDYGMLRMFSVYYDNPELDLRIFSKIEDAWEWLEVAGSGDPFVGMEPEDPRSP
jgi:hypothetical protein